MSDNKKKNPGAKGAAKSKLPAGFIVALAVIIAVGVVAGVVAGCGGDSSSNGGPKPPEFAYSNTAPKGAAKAYQFALDHPDILKQIPCYCGCGQEAGHTSNLDCFIKSRNGNEVTFDDHASYWDLWVEIALDVLQWNDEGIPVKEIRSRIDAKYSKYGPGTPTPPVQ